MKRMLLLIAAASAGLAPMASSAPSLDAAVSAFVVAQTQGLPGKVRVTGGSIDSRSQLGPCDAFDPFLPANGRLWGRSTVGVRCLGPSNWTAYVQVQVSVFGRYLRSARALPAGQAISEGDFDIVEADLTTLPTGVLTDPAQVIGKPPRIGLAAGQPLRADQIVSPPAVRQGQTVKTITRGPGFVVSSEGKALNSAAEGQNVQVRAASGQTLTGIARPGGIVEISY